MEYYLIDQPASLPGYGTVQKGIGRDGARFGRLNREKLNIIGALGAIKFE